MRFDPGLVGKWISLKTNIFAEDGFPAIESTNFRAGMRLRGLGNLVDQNSVSWNQINEWLRQLNRLVAAA
jgi:hypothetical protein